MSANGKLKGCVNDYVRAYCSKEDSQARECNGAVGLGGNRVYTKKGEGINQHRSHSS